MTHEVPESPWVGAELDGVFADEASWWLSFRDLDGHEVTCTQNLVTGDWVRESERFQRTVELDGTIMVRERWVRDGREMVIESITRPNGIMTVTLPDGTTTTSFPDGKSITRYPDRSQTSRTETTIVERDPPRGAPNPGMAITDRYPRDDFPRVESE